jgi:hypothetical protein
MTLSLWYYAFTSPASYKTPYPNIAFQFSFMFTLVKKYILSVSFHLLSLSLSLSHTHTHCSLQSRRGRVQEDKRMAYVYTHGLFIT